MQLMEYTVRTRAMRLRRCLSRKESRIGITGQGNGCLLPANRRCVSLTALRWETSMATLGHKLGTRLASTRRGEEVTRRLRLGGTRKKSRHLRRPPHVDLIGQDKLGSALSTGRWANIRRNSC